MLIAFSGLKGSGKDTAAQVLIEEYGFTKIAFADALREALLTLDPQVQVPMNLGKTFTDRFTANEFCVERLSDLVTAFGWDMLKNNVPEVRRLMQVFGTEVGRQLFGTNVWVDTLDKRFPNLSHPSARYVITDCRFENEAKFVDSNSGSIVWIERSGLTSDGHASEAGEVRKWRNWLIVNDKEIVDLANDVRQIMMLEGVNPIVGATTDSTD